MQLSYADVVKGKNNNNANNNVIDDHVEEFFPIDPATGRKVYTLSTQTDVKSMVYRYGIFGDTRFLDDLPKLTNEEYQRIIDGLLYKNMEITSWFGENCGNHRNDHDYDYHPKCDKCKERLAGLKNRINEVEVFISKLRTYMT